MRQLFEELVEIRVGVMPWMMPSFAVRQLILTYIGMFKAETETEQEFVRAVKDFGRFPLQEYDLKFSEEEAARMAACVYYCGFKDDGDLSSLPSPIAEAWRTDPALRTRLKDPLNLFQGLDGAPDNVFVWARNEGREQYPAVAKWLDSVTPFSRAFPT
jgi:hypothetical protein